MLGVQLGLLRRQLSLDARQGCCQHARRLTGGRSVMGHLHGVRPGSHHSVAPYAPLQLGLRGGARWGHRDCTQGCEAHGGSGFGEPECMRQL